MAPAAAAVAAAFVTLLKPRDELPDDVVDVAQLTSAVIDACRRHECDGTSDSEILKVTLELLQRKQSVDVQVLLLRLVRVLKMRKAWSLEEDSAVLSVLATLLLNVDAA
ncbi:PIF1-like helicase, partial [Globisporangium polare]